MSEHTKLLFSDEDFLKALRNSNKKIDIAKELKVVDLTSGGKVQPYVKGLQVENELNKVGLYYQYMFNKSFSMATVWPIMLNTTQKLQK